MKKIFLLVATSFMLTLTGCNTNDTFDLPTPVGAPTIKFFEPSLINSSTPSDIVTVLTKDNLSTELTLKVSEASTEFTPTIILGDTQKKVLNKYALFKKVPSLAMLPEDMYSITASTVKSGETTSTITVKILNYSKLPFGSYYIPILVMVEGKQLVHFVTITKDADYVPLSESNPKPIAPGSSRTKPMMMTAFVETNDWDPRNLAQFVLKNSHKPVFDMIVFFAPNMNYDAVKKKRYIFFNDKLQPIVNNPDIYLKPIKDRGIKIIFEILPNHQGVGYKNFQSYDEALDFAREAKMWTDKLGIDGWDLDEEYAEYYKRPELPISSDNGAKSILWYIRAMKEVMPDKILTLYEYGLPSELGTITDENNKMAKDYLDYGFANYGEGSYGSYFGIFNLNYFGYSIEANRSGLSFISRSAQRNLDSGYGGLMIFGMRGDQIKSGDAERELSKATQILYGQDCIFLGKYIDGPRDL